MRPLPATPDDITPTWLNRALGGAPDWHAGRVEAVELQLVGGSDSLMSAVLVAHVGVQGRNGSRGSLQLLIKLQRPDASPQDNVSYAAEAYFYREIASRAGIPVPLTYFADFDDQDRRLVIIQEFLADGRIGSATTMLSLSDLERVMSSLATLHATWWMSRELAGMDGIRKFDTIGRAITVLRSPESPLPDFLERFGHLIDPAVAGYYATMPHWMEQVEAGLSDRFTLVHLDCSAKNLFIPADLEREPVLFDWGLVRAGNPGIDLATLLCYSMDPREHDRMPDLVKSYHAKILAKDVHDYDFDTLWNDVRYGCLWRLAAPIANAAAGTPEREAHARTIIPLLDSALLRTGALSLIDTDGVDPGGLAP